MLPSTGNKSSVTHKHEKKELQAIQAVRNGLLSLKEYLNQYIEDLTAKKAEEITHRTHSMIGDQFAGNWAEKDHAILDAETAIELSKEREKWKQIADRRLTDYFIDNRNTIEDEISKLETPADSLLQSAHRQTYRQRRAQALMAALFIRLLENPGRNDLLPTQLGEIKEEFKALQHILFSPLDILPAEFKQIENNLTSVYINRWEVSELLKTYLRIEALRLIAASFKELLSYREDSENYLKDCREFPELANLNAKWFTARFEEVKKAALSPQKLVTGPHHPPLPKKDGPSASVLNIPKLPTWYYFWQYNKTIPLSARFAITRLFQQQNLPNPTWALSSQDHKIFYWLFFWLQLPLFYSTLTRFYRDDFKNALQQCRNYLHGRLPVLSLIKPSIGITNQVLKLLFAPIFLLGPLAQGLTSLPFILLNLGWQKLSMNYPRLTKIGVMGFNLLETLKDSLLLGAGLYYWSLSLDKLLALKQFAALNASLGLLGTYTALAMTVVSATLLIFAFTHVPFAMLAEQGYENPFAPLYRVCNSALMRLTGLIALTVTPTAAVILGLGRLLNYASSPQGNPGSPSSNPSSAHDDDEEEQLLLRKRATANPCSVTPSPHLTGADITQLNAIHAEKGAQKPPLSSSTLPTIFAHQLPQFSSQLSSVVQPSTSPANTLQFSRLGNSFLGSFAIVEPAQDEDPALTQDPSSDRQSTTAPKPSSRWPF